MVRVMAVGVFDLLHAGHLHYVEQAKTLGDELVVVVAHDETVRKQKHEPVTNRQPAERSDIRYSRCRETRRDSARL